VRGLKLYFASTEKPLPAQIIAFLRGFLIIIPMAFLFDITGVWLSFPITECLVVIVGITFYKKINRKK